MPLINLKTDLKSLKYGRDRVGGGSSNQPFVQTPIPESLSLIGITGGYDSLTRGGTLIGGAITADERRIGKLINTANTFQGAAFKTKLNTLSKLNVRTQADTGDQNQGTYLTRRTLGQVAAQPLGEHITLFRGNLSYYDAVKNQQTGEQATGRLVDLFDSKIKVKSEGTELYSYPGGPGSNKTSGNTIINLSSDRTGPNNTKLANYYGASGIKNPNYNLLRSPNDLILGAEGLNQEEEYIQPPILAKGFQAFERPTVSLNRKTLFSVGISNKLTSPVAPSGYSDLASEYNIITDKGVSNLPTNNQGVNSSPALALIGQAPINYVYTQKLIQTSTPSQETSVDQLVDFRQIIKAEPENKKLKLAYTDYTAFSRTTTGLTADGTTAGYGLGNPGTRNSQFDRSVDPATLDLTQPNNLTTDLINYSARESSRTPTTADNDLIPFYITILEYGGDYSTLQFRAFVKGFSDGYTADWKGFKYLGRGENFYSYGGFSRTINLSFTVHAQSKQELLRQYEKLNYLASSLTPNYSSNGIMRGNFVELTFGDYINQQPGILKGLTFSIPDNSPYELGRYSQDQDQAGTSTDKGDRLAHIIEVTNFSFEPIHNFVPRIGKPFISLGSTGQGYTSIQTTSEDSNPSESTPTTQDQEQQSSTDYSPQAQESNDSEGGWSEWD